MSGNVYYFLHWIHLLWIPALIILKLVKPGMSTWLFVTWLLLNLVLLFGKFKGDFFIGEYNNLLLIAAQLVIIIINRNKRKSTAQSATLQEIDEAQAALPSRHSNVFEQRAPAVNNKKNIFINYRKEDSSGYSLALYHELIKWYHKDTIFKDFNTIEPGEDFAEAIDNALNDASVLIVIMGDRWNDILQTRSQKRHKDFVRIEIATALAKNIYTIPVTINSTIMPSEEELPEDLVRLSHRQFLNIDQTRFETDVLKLVKVIDKRLGIKRA